MPLPVLRKFPLYLYEVMLSLPPSESLRFPPELSLSLSRTALLYVDAALFPHVLAESTLMPYCFFCLYGLGLVREKVDMGISVTDSSVLSLLLPLLPPLLFLPEAWLATLSLSPPKDAAILSSLFCVELRLYFFPMYAFPFPLLCAFCGKSALRLRSADALLTVC